jgi:glycerophosphoryl diester phosphodiesterase
MKPRQHHQPLIIAHRGASQDAPENTLAAFAEAWAQQADGIEGDYCMTLDQQLVCIHDDDTLRTAGQFMKVAETNLAQLRSLEYGKWKHPQFTGQQLPLLSEVLAQVPELRWCVIELKTGPEIVSELKAQLDLHAKDLERVLVIAFNEQTITQSKHQLPAVRAHWLTDFKQQPDGSWTPTPRQIMDTIARCGADGVGLENNPAAVTAEFVAALHGAGLKEFHVWTVDKPQEAAYYVQLGAWGLTTNCPGYLRSHLSDN